MTPPIRKRPSGKTTHRPPGEEAGFTLFEVIVVLILIGILAAVAMTRVGKSSAEVVGQAEMIRSHLRFAQSRSMNNHAANWGVVFQSDTTYQLFYCKSGGACQLVTTPIPGSQVNASNQYTLMEGVTLSPGGIAILFDEWGAPFKITGAITNAQDPLTVDETLTLTDGVNTAVITISPETGYVS